MLDIKDKRKQKVLLVASAMFLKHGLEQVKMTDIAKECQLGVASLYRYFGTKTILAIETATLLWKDLDVLFEDKFKSDEYLNKNGINQIKTLLGIYETMYLEHPEFLKFINQFDNMMINEHVSKDMLAAYEESIFDFYKVGKTAFDKGVTDGTIKRDVQFEMIYRTFSHAVNGMSQKFIRGEIIPGDDFKTADREIRQLIDITVYYMEE